MITNEMVIKACKGCYGPMLGKADLSLIRAALEAVEADIRNAALEDAAKVVDGKGLQGCERGVTDPGTGAYECRRLDRGDCYCSEMDEVAEEIRAIKSKVTQ